MNPNNILPGSISKRAILSKILLLVLLSMKGFANPYQAEIVIWGISRTLDGPVKAIAAGAHHTVALKEDGTVVCATDTDTYLSETTVKQWANEVDNVNDAVSNPSGSYPAMNVGKVDDKDFGEWRDCCQTCNYGGHWDLACMVWPSNWSTDSCKNMVCNRPQNPGHCKHWAVNKFDSTD